jgi:ABC-type multidrug transport system fused ATPase/permease subunit
MKDLEIRYASDLPPAINLSGELRIKPGEHVGLVGRTGSGKSTLGMSLVRLLEYSTQSRIFIDDVDIGQLGVSDLCVMLFFVFICRFKCSKI